MSSPKAAEKKSNKAAPLSSPKKDEPSARAVGNKIKGSPQKLGLLADLIRGQSVDQALNYLRFCRKRAAPVVSKVLYSAMCNAENNHNLDVDRLCVSEVWVGKSQTLKRWHARARGRGARILKHYSNIVVVLREKGDH